MGKEIITFGDVENKKLKFCQHKNLISIYDVNIDIIGVSYKIRLGKNGFKYFIEYEDDYEKFALVCNISKNEFI